ncbi:hypothetical protein C8R46DRAFT_1115196 [Mycena filopes]|nr:hypothetical protein C8R46DRAFT_1115196 [Mycena filopes]
MPFSNTGALVREGVYAANAASPVFPPLQAALGLVTYIDQSIDQFKANKEEIEEIGAYSKRLSEQLDRSLDANTTAAYVRVILDLHVYLSDVSSMNFVVQLAKRSRISRKLQEYRTKLDAEFQVFSIGSSFDVQQFQKEAELARQKDDREARELLQTIAKSIVEKPSGVSELGERMRLSADHGAVETLQKELESLTVDPPTGSGEPGLTREERSVVQESLALTNITRDANYRWFPSTFKTSQYTRSQIAQALMPSVIAIVAIMQESGLLAHGTNAQLANLQFFPLNQILSLFVVLDGRPRDAKLVRTFQRALLRGGGLQESDIVNPALLADLGPTEA